MGKLMRGAVVAGLIAVLLLGPASAPLLAAPGTAASLQAGSFAPGVLDTIARGVAVTAGLSSQGAPSAVIGDVGALISGRPTPVAEEEVTPIPQEETTPVSEEEPTPVPEEEATPTPEGEQNTDLAGLEEYSSGGITLRAPADWDVIEGGFGSLFDISVPDSEFAAVLQDGGGDFPGMIMVVFFAGIPDLLLGEFLEDGTLTSVEFSETSQQLPLVAVHFDSVMDEVEGSGVMYVISPGETVYVFIAFAPADEWEGWAPQVQQVVDSITFDEDLLTLTTAEDGELVYSDDVNFQLTIPEGWHVSNTNDESLLVLVTDPGYRFAMAIGTDSSFDEELGSDLEGILTTPDGEIDAETQALVFDLILGTMGDGSDFTVDESLNAVYPHDGGVTFRVVGAGDFGDGVSVPVAIYLDLRTDGGLINMLLGDVDSALEVEPQVLEIINSVELLQ